MVRRAVQCGGIDGVNAAGAFNTGQSTAGFLCKELSLEFMFAPYVQNWQALVCAGVLYLAAVA